MATIESLIKDYDKVLREIKKGRPVQLAAVGVMGAMAERIFEQGQTTNGGLIGSYNSTDEIYINPDRLPRSTPRRGKPGRERAVSNRKTTYFTSYKAMRAEIGRESGKINLRLTNDLQSDFANSKVSAGTNSIAGQFRPTKINSLTYAVKLSRPQNVDKVKGLEGRFGPIFAPSRLENKIFADSLQKELMLLHNA